MRKLTIQLAVSPASVLFFLVPAPDRAPCTRFFCENKGLTLQK